MFELKNESSHSRNNKIILEAITTKFNQQLDALRQELHPHGSSFEDGVQKHEQYREEIAPKPPDHDQDTLNYKKCPKKRVKKRTRSLIFSGTSRDPEAYLQWEDNMEKWLQSNNIPNERKLTQAISALTKKANKWWLKENAPTIYKQPVLDWRDLKVRMHKEFVEKSLANPKMKMSTSSPTLQEECQHLMGTLQRGAEQNQNVMKPQEELNVSSSSALHKQPAAPHQGTDAGLKELDKEEKEKDANEKHMVLEESAKNNIKEKEEVADSLQVSKDYEASPVKENH